MKKIFLIFIILIFISSPVFAQKIPVRITNKSIITTTHDEIELGDALPFKVVNDVYVNNSLYIKKDAPVNAIVDFVQDNGWAGYSAGIRFKKFIIKNVNGQETIINYPISIDGNSEKFAGTVNYATGRLYILAEFFGRLSDVFMFIRGHELYVKPNQINFNIFIEG